MSAETLAWIALGVGWPAGFVTGWILSRVWLHRLTPEQREFAHVRESINDSFLRALHGAEPMSVTATVPPPTYEAIKEALASTPDLATEFAWPDPFEKGETDADGTDPQSLRSGHRPR